MVLLLPVWCQCAPRCYLCWWSRSYSVGGKAAWIYFVVADVFVAIVVIIITFIYTLLRSFSESEALVGSCFLGYPVLKHDLLTTYLCLVVASPVVSSLVLVVVVFMVVVMLFLLLVSPYVSLTE